MLPARSPQENSAGSVNARGAFSFGSMRSTDSGQVEERICASLWIRGGLLLHHFCLPVDNLAGEAVDGDMNPVMLFAFDNEIVLQTCSTWLEVTRLRDHVDQQSPSPGLCRVG